MKKLVTILMCLCLCFQFTACGKDKEDTKWIAEDAKKIGSEITSGEFVIDGEVYTFPMNLQDILDKGWHVSNNYVNADTFTLEPGEYTEAFSIYPDDDHDHSITVSVINMTGETATVEECLVTDVEMTNTEFDFLLPGEITKRSTQKDVEAAYGDATEVDEQENKKVYTYTYTTEEGYNCSVELKVYNKKNATYPLSEVSYSLVYSDVYDVENECRTFIDSSMKASFYNETEEYVANLYDTKEGADALYESEVAYFVSYIMYYVDIDESYMTDEIISEFSEIAKTVLSKTKWEINELDVEEDEYSGTVELALYPTNYFDVIDSKVDEVIDTFNVKYETVDWNNISDSELETIEIDYANMVLEAIKGMENDVESAEAVVKTYEISDNIFTDEQWNEIDDIIMGIEYEE